MLRDPRVLRGSLVLCGSTFVTQEFEGRQTAQFAAVRVEIAGVKSDLMKWSFVFWCGAVAAIAALAGVLRQ